MFVDMVYLSLCWLFGAGKCCLAQVIQVLGHLSDVTSTDSLCEGEGFSAQCLVSFGHLTVHVIDL